MKAKRVRSVIGPRLPDLVAVVAEQAWAIAGEDLPKRYLTHEELAVAIIHAEAVKHGIGVYDAALALALQAGASAWTMAGVERSR